MAFALKIGGTRLNLPTGNCVPAKPSATLAAIPPLRGMLLKNSTAGNEQVDQCAASDVPVALLFHTNSGNGTLSILELRDCDLELEYTGSTAFGQQIQANGTAGTIPIGGMLIDQVKAVNSGGAGLIVAKDEVTGLITVRFS